MKGNTITEFIESLHSNCDKELVYQGRRYLLQGWINNDKSYSLRMCEITENYPTVFFSNNYDRAACVAEFENAELFDGKSIYEAENDITILYD